MHSVMRVIGIGLVFTSPCVLSTGCRTAPAETRQLLFFPSPPQEPRVQFLTWASGAEQVEPGRTSFQEFVLGDEPVVQRVINKPYGLAVRDGVVYVCDTKDLSICKLDFRNHAYSVFGHQGPGRLRKPINISIDALGYKFVVDPYRKQVVVFGPDDHYVTALDVPEPCHPVDVALYENEVFVLDNDETCQVVVFDRTTSKVARTFGSPGREPGQFNRPSSLAISPTGEVYVSDTHNFRIQKLSRAGEVIWAKGAPGFRLGEFGRPRGIRVGPDGVVYVVDGATELVQMFDPQGQLLMRFGGPGDVPGALVLPSTLAIDASSFAEFSSYIHKDFKPAYLLIVASQYGPRLVNVYAFGAFPEGFKLSESSLATLPPVEPSKEVEIPAPGMPPIVTPVEPTEEGGQGEPGKVGSDGAEPGVLPL